MLLTHNREGERKKINKENVIFLIETIPSHKSERDPYFFHFSSLKDHPCNTTRELINNQGKKKKEPPYSFYIRNKQTKNTRENNNID